MKKVLLSAVALLAFGFANAQEEKANEGFAKGDLFVSGSVGFGSDKQDDVKVNDFTFAPKLGYFVSENIALGLGLGIGSGKINVDGDTAAENKTLSFGAFGRYYIKTDKFAPFAELNVNYGTTSTEYTEFMGELMPFGSGEDVNTLSVDLAAGFNYFVSSNFALETSVAMLGYSSSKEDVDGAEARNKFGLGLNMATVNFGLVYKF